MTTVQITIRVPEDLVSYADQLVAEGAVQNRTAAVVEALRQMRKQREDEREVDILKEMAGNPDPELEGFNRWAWQQGQQAWADLD
jgi:Arc/MetJ-type ribon-helix-helix transcriptional regulator